jgi:sensor histidine kinase regulating citrate/malate metabolism
LLKDQIKGTIINNTTSGHGFGLHFCANALKEIDGAIEAISDDTGKGAEFKKTSFK